MKNKKFLTCLGLIGLTILPTVASTAVITSIKLSEAKKPSLSFDNQSFKNNGDLKEYVNNNLVTASLNAPVITHYYDGQVFNSSQTLRDYLEDKFEIEDDITWLNPEEHTISSNGELSDDVILDDDNALTKVYEGKNKLAYLDKELAKNTYCDYQKVYKVDTQEFTSKESAFDYLYNVKSKLLKLEDNKGQKFYYNGGISGTKEEIISWIKRHTRMGFTYQGKDYSDFNYEKFREEFASKVEVGTELFNRNVTKAVDLNKRSYWLDLTQKYRPSNKFPHRHIGFTNRMCGFFIGPKYVQTTEKLPASLDKKDFRLIDSFSMNRLQGLVTLAMLGTTTAAGYIINNFLPFNWRLEKGHEDEIVLENYLKSVIGKDNIHLQDFSKFINEKTNEKVKDIINLSTLDVETIRQRGGEDFTDLDMFLIIIKRIMTASRVYDNLDPLELEHILKPLLWDVLKTTHTKTTNELLNYEVWDSLSIEDISNLFIDPDKFMANDTAKLEILKMNKRIYEAVDSAIKPLGAISDETVEMMQVYEKPGVNKKEIWEKQDKLNGVIEETSKIQSEAIGLLGSLADTGALAAGATEALTSASGIGAIVMVAISAAWSQAKLLSSVNFKTFEYKIDENNSIYYMTPVRKIPIIGLELDESRPIPPVATTLVSEAAMDYIKPTKHLDDKGNKVKYTDEIVYEYKGKYYTHPEGLKELLLRDIYKNPELFIPSSKIFNNVMINDKSYKISKELEEMNRLLMKKNDSKNSFSKAKYQKLIEIEKDKYAQYVFKDSFEQKSDIRFTDGFGNNFATKREALASFNENIMNQIKELDFSYIREDDNGQRNYFKNKDDYINFVQEHQAINEKFVRKSQLLNTTTFDKLDAVDNRVYYSIYHIDYYGETRYFKTEEQVWRFIYSHETIKKANKDLSIMQYDFKGHKFYSEADLNMWVREQTKILDKNGKITR